MLDLLGIGKALASERIAAEELPPALLQIEPAPHNSSGEREVGPPLACTVAGRYAAQATMLRARYLCPT